MAFKSFYDTNHDGFLSGFEKSRYEMDNIGYPTYAVPDYASELYERDLLKNDGFDTSDTDFMYGTSASLNDYGDNDEDVDDDGFEDDFDFDVNSKLSRYRQSGNDGTAIAYYSGKGDRQISKCQRKRGRFRFNLR